MDQKRNFLRGVLGNEQINYALIRGGRIPAVVRFTGLLFVVRLAKVGRAPGGTSIVKIDPPMKIVSARDSAGSDDPGRPMTQPMRDKRASEG